MSIAVGKLNARFRALLGFSRVVQALLSVAQPFLAALIALHGFPSLDRTILGLLAAAMGFLAVFALNDLLDVDLDRTRFAHLRDFDGFDIDSAMSRHPLAQRQINFSLGFAWISILGLLALVGAYELSPIAAVLFLVAALLEISYCKLACVTPLKFLVSGAMVGCGALAGWVAMTNEIRTWEMIVVFIWMFAWEIGGRNIVNDFADVDEDVRLGIKTIPVVHGPEFAARLTFLFLLVTNAAALALESFSRLPMLYLIGATIAGLYLLVVPGIRLLQSPAPPVAMKLFNKASFYPPLMLLVLVASIYLPF